MKMESNPGLTAIVAENVRILMVIDSFPLKIQQKWNINGFIFISPLTNSFPTYETSKSVEIINRCSKYFGSPYKIKGIFIIFCFV